MVWGYFNNLEQGQTERDRARVKEKASSCDEAFRSFRAIPAWRQSRFCSWRAASLQRFPSGSLVLSMSKSAALYKPLHALLFGDIELPRFIIPLCLFAKVCKNEKVPCLADLLSRSTC
jgi:hypothetical protein